MSYETLCYIGLLLLVALVAYCIFVVIDGIFTRRSYQRLAFEYRRLCQGIESIEDKLDSIAAPILTSEVLFPTPPDLACDKEDD